MSQSRYNNIPGRVPSVDTSKIYYASITGVLDFDKVLITDMQRLDTIAGNRYGDSQYWWVIAAASGIGWGLQVPAGTVIRIPRSLRAALRLVA